jgi:Holliday junction resolvase RusA-like endonuclease
MPVAYTKSEPKLLLDLYLEVNPSTFAINRKWKAPGVLSDLYRNSKKMLRQECTKAREAFSECAVVVEIRMKSGCDLDAPLKNVFDALQKSVIKDDKQIRRLVIDFDDDWEGAEYIAIEVKER